MEPAVRMLEVENNPSRGRQMVKDDLVKCPLCGGFTHVGKPELVDALNDPKIRHKVECFLEELLHSENAELAAVSAPREPAKDFNKNVHGWNPNIPVWQRSHKE